MKKNNKPVITRSEELQKQIIKKYPELSPTELKITVLFLLTWQLKQLPK